MAVHVATSVIVWIKINEKYIYNSWYHLWCPIHEGYNNQRHALESLAEIDFLLFVYDIWHNGPYSELIKIILRN